MVSKKVIVTMSPSHGLAYEEISFKKIHNELIHNTYVQYT